MDYDDNDIQGQNIHVASEGNSKISPILHPYDIPKFDFDDSLQGHLRFESLVENEVFLGIPSQEDSRWIEEYSQGRSVIEFSSGDPVPCSVSRRDNVWSEAASSESVEMLLKSVGQEESVLGETLVEESDSVNEPVILTETMDSDLKQGNGIDDIIQSDAVMPTDLVSNDIPELDQLCGGELRAKLISQSQDADQSVSESKSNIEREKNASSLPDHPIDGIAYDSSQRVVDNLLTESLDDKMRSVSETHNDNTASCQNFNEGTEDTNNQEMLPQVFIGGSKVGPDNVDMDDQLSNRSSIETCAYNVEGPSDVVHEDSVKTTSLLVVQVSHTQVAEGSVVVLDSADQSQGSVSLESSQISQRPDSIMLPEEPQTDLLGDVTVGLNASEVVSTKQEIDGLPGLNKTCPPSPITAVQNTPEQENFNASGCFKDCLDTSPSELVTGKTSTETVVAAINASDAQVGVSIVRDHNFTTTLSNSAELHHDKLSSEPGHAYVGGENLSPHGEGVSKLSMVDMEGEAAGTSKSEKNVVTFPDNGSENIMRASGSEPDTTTQTEPVSVSVSAAEEGYVASGVAVDGVRLVSCGGSTADSSVCNLPESPRLGLSSQLLDNRENVEVEETACLNEIPQEIIVSDPITEGTASEIQMGASIVCAGQVVQQMDDHSVTLVEHCQEAVAIKSGRECSETLELNSVAHNSSAKSKDDVDASGLENTKEFAPERNQIVESLKHAVDMSNDEASVDLVRLSECETSHVVQNDCNSGSAVERCSDSPKVAGCIDVSQCSKDQKEVGMASIGNASLPEVTNDVDRKSQSMSPNICEKSISEGANATFEVVEGSSSKSGVGQGDPEIVQEVPAVTPQEPSNLSSPVGPKGTPKRKPRGKSAVTESTKKGNQEKETTPARQSMKGEKATRVALQVDSVKSYGNVVSGGIKQSGVTSIPVLHLPDLNSSVVAFQQPFTDAQQVQLRAQIFVYGDLIKMATPDEAYMVAAFGQRDGSRSHWEPAWRLHGQNFHANNLDTPVQLRSGFTDAGNKLLDQSNQHGSHQIKIVTSANERSNSKATPSLVVKPIIPLSSPLWNATVSTPSCLFQSSAMPRNAIFDYNVSFSPSHTYQTPPTQNLGLQNSWLNRGPFPGQWMASSPASSLNVSARFSTLPITEAVTLTTVKESGGPGTKLTSPVPFVQKEDPGVFSGVSSLHEAKQAMASTQPSAELKSRKRKKVSNVDPLGQISLPGRTQLASVSSPVVVGGSHSQIASLASSQTESVMAPVLTSIYSSSVTVSTPVSLGSKSSGTEIIPAAFPKSSSDRLKTEDQKMKCALSEETISKVAEAKAQAEDAAANAAAAVSHCESVWSQLEKQMSSGLLSEVENKLASAAVAVAAAVSVAKAAAAAAKIASNAAEQAKLMSEEALSSGVISLPSVVHNSGKATTQLTLKGGDGSGDSSSIIVSADETARKRVEASSAASKRAENLDALVKAAELAAEAVSHAGKIVAVGECLPLGELLKCGPDNYWKTPLIASSEQQDVSVDKHDNNLTSNSIEPGPNDKEIQPSKHVKKTGAISIDLTEDKTRSVDENMAGILSDENEPGDVRGHVSDLSKTIRVIPELETGLSNSSVGQNELKNSSQKAKETKINEDCLVEVLKNVGIYKDSWYIAKVLSVVDGKAFVCYSDLQSHDRSEKLKEWVQLESDGAEAPRIRIAHPMTTMQVEGTRKRRRSAIADYAWSVGDKVDAWMQNCWREGVVTEKNKNDETSVTVHFYGQGETVVVRSWNLRPTLMWKDGEWIDSSCPKGDQSAQGNKQQEKRLKVDGSPFVEVKDQEKISRTVDVAESGRQQESVLLPLTSNERLFNLGKVTRDENKFHAQRMTRSGLQKEGPRVIFGVPKPGKKQKFMDVSKHYVADRSTKNSKPANDSVRFGKKLMLQGSGLSHGWNNNFKRDGAKERQVAEGKSRGLKSGKSQNLWGRPLAQKGSSSTSAKSVSQNDAMTTENLIKDSVMDDEIESRGGPSTMEFGSSSNAEDASEDSIPVRVHRPRAKPVGMNNGKLAPSREKSSNLQVKDSSIPESSEPRRSNRRIQPTSRLLEGLQSSLSVAKAPTRHDRSQRNQNKSTSKRDR